MRGGSWRAMDRDIQRRTERIRREQGHEAANRFEHEQYKKAAQTQARGLIGAAAGAAAGSVIPVVGTAVGALVGGIIGIFTTD